jgi:hypothetical protein
MPHPALIWIAVGAAVAGATMVRREVRRIERAHDAEKRARAEKLEGIPLQRDPVTGVYRPGDRRRAEH